MNATLNELKRAVRVAKEHYESERRKKESFPHSGTWLATDDALSAYDRAVERRNAAIRAARGGGA